MMIQQAAWLEEVHTGDFPGRVRAGCQKRCLEKALVHRSSFDVCILNLAELREPVKNVLGDFAR